MIKKENKLKEGESYIKHNFKVLKKKAQFRVLSHLFKLLFIRETVEEIIVLFPR